MARRMFRSHLEKLVKKERTPTCRIAQAWLVLAAGVLIGTTGLDAATYRPVVGEPFPDLQLPSLEDGTPTSIVAFRGQKVILHVFASW